MQTNEEAEQHDQSTIFKLEIYLPIIDNCAMLFGANSWGAADFAAFGG